MGRHRGDMSWGDSLGIAVAALLLAGCAQGQAEAALGQVINTASDAVAGIGQAPAQTAAAPQAGGEAAPGARSSAQATKESTTDLVRFAVDTCIRSLRDPAAMPDAFRAAGWELTPFAGSNEEFELGKGGAYGYLATDDGGYCMFGPLPNLKAAKALAAELVEKPFAGLYQRGAPEGPAGPCDGYVIFPSRGTIVISYEGLGNDPVCPDPAGAVIQVSLSSS